MQGIVKTGWLVGGALLAVSLAGGCTDYKKENQFLQEKITQLTNDLNDTTARADRAEAEAAALKEKMLGKDDQIAELRKSMGVPQSKYDQKAGEVAELRAELEKLKADQDNWKTGTGIAMTEISNDVLFAPGSAKLTAAGKAALAAIVSKLNGKYAGMDIMVLGHTDSDPIKKSKKQWQDNWDLSAGRALAVTRFLIARGVQPSRIVASGAGEHRPVGPNTTKAGKARNRRVEIFAFRKSVVK